MYEKLRYLPGDIISLPGCGPEIVNIVSIRQAEFSPDILGIIDNGPEVRYRPSSDFTVEYHISPRPESQAQWPGNLYHPIELGHYKLLRPGLLRLKVWQAEFDKAVSGKSEIIVPLPGDVVIYDTPLGKKYLEIVAIEKDATGTIHYLSAEDWEAEYTKLKYSDIEGIHKRGPLSLSLAPLPVERRIMFCPMPIECVFDQECPKVCPFNMEDKDVKETK